jgi:hypothetical protein
MAAVRSIGWWWLAALLACAPAWAVESVATESVAGGLPSWELIPQISVINPEAFSLASGGYVSHYSRSSFGLPAVALGISRRLARWQGFEFRAVGDIGYGAKSGSIAVSRRDASGRDTSATLSDSMTLHWLPASAGIRTLYAIPGITFFRPSLALALGSSLIVQQGNLPGIDGAFLIPFWSVAPGLSFFDGQGGDWFGGFNFSLTYLSTFASSQTLHGTSFDLSVNIFL